MEVYSSNSGPFVGKPALTLGIGYARFDWGTWYSSSHGLWMAVEDTWHADH